MAIQVFTLKKLNVILNLTIIDLLNGYHYYTYGNILHYSPNSYSAGVSMGYSKVGGMPNYITDKHQCISIKIDPEGAKCL